MIRNTVGLRLRIAFRCRQSDFRRSDGRPNSRRGGHDAHGLRQIRCDLTFLLCLRQLDVQTVFDGICGRGRKWPRLAFSLRIFRPSVRVCGMTRHAPCVLRTPSSDPPGRNARRLLRSQVIRVAPVAMPAPRASLAIGVGCERSSPT
jgi:hypothetical protein